MSEIPSLISDLAVILVSAGLVTLLFKKLKQPVVLGYVVAGILAGPSIEEIPTVSEVESIRIWADIGVIFLLFALGLDFSFKKLMKVGGTAVIGAITIVIGMMTAGYATGLTLGWGHMNSLFLGGMLSMSSTTIIFKLNLVVSHNSLPPKLFSFFKCVCITILFLTVKISIMQVYKCRIKCFTLL